MHKTQNVSNRISLEFDIFSACDKDSQNLLSLCYICVYEVLVICMYK